MYVPPAFREDDLDALHGWMRTYSFATLVSPAPDGLVATHLPVLLDAARGPYGTLRGHVARANPHWHAWEAREAREAREAGESLLLFQGPHAYVSPSWYAVRPAVPTWNYVAVHAYGRPRLLTDDAALTELLRDMVETYEGAFEQPWRMELPREYQAALQKGIVGFEMEITRLEGKAKLSQNRSPGDRDGVIAGLLAQRSPETTAVARLMSASVLEHQGN